MKIIRAKDYQEMSKIAANILQDKINEHPAITLGLATGGTPEQTYAYLSEDTQTSFEHVTTFNLDEYIGLSPTNPNSYHYYMNKHLFSKVNIPTEQIFLPNGFAEDLLEECRSYEQKIKQHNGIDLQLLGLGQNGHIGFNEPGTSFERHTHIVSLEPSTIEANARFFDSIEEVPKQAITMGIASIMKSKEILVLVSGKAKNAALEQLMHGKIDEQFPASILNTHENVTIIADEEALGNITFMRREANDR
ncbi:glucosamine-6-phosphate deaminase [Gracilibacillus sp. S3-1-1]|uniref:Glucosamine-6-phosphate deaminase n=1 Tax=Gracilibacillus pellucidus TaxID=3095368 RepID=A0ACC6M3V0_9BACI|nr:glucosamine-6-phosphate deaminase [Gracilibacillus sp. S3-1-1]MDX8045639.1 glucosamine-6-phosphate deaminase [Gracilibacillus sp. S3-1-1]